MRGRSPDINTNRTKLRRYLSSDLDRFSELTLNEEVQHFMGGEDVESEEEAKTLFQRVQYLYKNPPTGRHFEIWAITFNDQVVGHFELKQTPYTETGELEAVYFLDKPLWGKGIMTEVLNSIVEYAHSMNRQVIDTFDPENKATVQVLRKAGIERSENIIVDGTDIHKTWIRIPS